MRATSAAAVLILALLPRAEQPPAYRQIVDRYRTAPNDGVERMLALAEPARREGIEQALGASGHDAWSWDELASAAIMHTDAGFYFLTRQQPAVPFLVDAEKLMLRALDTGPGHDLYVRRWYGTVESVLKSAGDAVSAKAFASHYADLLKKYPQRARAFDAYHRGVFAEYDGCQKGEFLTITGLTESGGNLVQRYFVPAARELESALTLDPDLHDAALHLGRVRMLEGREPDAMKWFQRAAQSPSRGTAYLAHLFLGAFAERASRWNEAEAEYRAAATLFPTGQSAAVALAQFLDRRDQPAEGSRTLAALFAPSRARVVDPWWQYFEEAGAESSSKIAMMRAEVTK